MPGNQQRQSDFDAAAAHLLGGPPPSRSHEHMHTCTHYRGGTGEVLQFTNVGGACERHVVTASRDKLPAQVRDLPRGTDLFVTFATGSVATMATNWILATRKAGLENVLLGALDEQMMEACAQHAVPCVLIEGGEITKALAKRKVGNVRSDPRLYPSMSVLKVGFYRELLTFGFNVWACDADAIFINDPRPLIEQAGFATADVAVATDCIDIPSDTRYALLHCDFNTGLVYLRARPEVIDFAERWRETVANAKEARIRDQAAFNMLTKARPLKPLEVDGKRVPRVFKAANGDGHIKVAVLPLAQFLNGHTYFVQHAHTLPGAPPPISVHMTYQFAEGYAFE